MVVKVTYSSFAMEDERATKVPPWAVDDDDHEAGPGVNIDADPRNPNWMRELARRKPMEQGDPGEFG
jgi:hypothetical protein